MGWDSPSTHSNANRHQREHEALAGVAEPSSQDHIHCISSRRYALELVLYRTDERTILEGLSSCTVVELAMGKLTHYDVFLKTTFVSHLNAALCDSFLDAKSLMKGRHSFTSINKALSRVLVHVATEEKIATCTSTCSSPYWFERFNRLRD